MKIKTIILDDEEKELFTVGAMPENSEIEIEIKDKIVIITNKVKPKQNA